MKKMLILFIFMAFIAPTPAKAISNDDLLVQIQSLLKIVQQLQSQLAALNGTPPKNSAAGLASGQALTLPTFCSSLSTTRFGIGIRSNSVIQLQQFLKSTGDFNYQEFTNYYGNVTKKAVQKYQCREMGICSGTPSTNGYGLAGPGTRRSMCTVRTPPTTSSVTTYTPAPSVTTPSISTTIQTTTNIDTPTTTQSNRSCDSSPHNTTQTRVRYQNTTEPFGVQCAEEEQSRTCNNGIWTGWNGTYTNTSCSIQGASSCQIAGLTLNNGQSKTLYQSTTVPFGSTCQSQTRICTNGILSGNYSSSSCIVGEQQITYSWQTGEWDQCDNRQQTRNVVCRGSDGNTSSDNTCTQIKPSTTQSCQVSQQTECHVNGTVVSSGESKIFYSSTHAIYGRTCTSISQERSCLDGALSGESWFDKVTCMESTSPVAIPPSPNKKLFSKSLLPVSKQGIGIAQYDVFSTVLKRFMRFFRYGMGTIQIGVMWDGIEHQTIAPSTQPDLHCPAPYKMFPHNEQERIELGMHHYHCYNSSTFTEIDKQVSLASSYGMKVGAILYSSPKQFRNEGCTGFAFGSRGTVVGGACVPSDASLPDYEDYVTFLSARYNGGIRGKIDHWIVWNEVASYLWTDWNPIIPKSDYSAEADNRRIDKYAQMMRVTHRAVRRHQDKAMIYVSTDQVWSKNAVATRQPHAHMSTKTLLEGLWDRLGTSIDWSVAVHPYGRPNEGTDDLYTFGNLSSLVLAFQHKQLRSRGITDMSNAPQAYVAATEQGWPSEQFSEHEQARMICMAHDAIVDEPYYVYTAHNYFHSTEPSGSLSDQGAHFGLIPYRIPRDLTGMENTPTGKAYISTSDPYKWGKVQNHYCCTEFSLGCPATDTDEAYLTDPRVFDPEWYRTHNSDLSNMIDDELRAHWLQYGVNEGRSASVYLDPKEYLSLYSDVQNAFGVNGYKKAIRHFVEYGIKEGRVGRRAFLNFDTGIYHERYSDLRNLSNKELYAHWLQYGQSEGRKANRPAPLEPEYFNPYFYRNNYNDLDRLNITVGDLENHWQNQGISEKRDSHPFFHISEYIDMYNDAKQLFNAQRFTNLLTGFKNAINSRVGVFALHQDVFNSEEYESLYPDLQNAFHGNSVQAKQHRMQYGIAEGRNGNVTFSPSDYLYLNTDVAQGIGNTNYLGAIAHYMRYGKNEGRSTIITTHPAVFNPAFYRNKYPDLAHMNDDQLREHWISFGIKEGRQASTVFSSRAYLNRHADLKAVFGATGYEQAVRHYVKSGIGEGRNGRPENK